MTFFITNDYEYHYIKLIHLFEKRPTLNEQLPIIEKKIKLPLEQYFQYNYQLPYTIYKNIHLIDNSKTDNLFFVIDINKFKLNHGFKKEMLMFFNGCMKYLSNTKIVFVSSDYLLQNYLQKNKNLQNTNISIVNLIKYVKHTLLLLKETKSCLVESKIPFISLPNLVHEMTKIKYMQLIRFLNYRLDIDPKYTAPVLEHKCIKNWDKIFNSLSNTEFNKYLKYLFSI